jgi:hypothetical protein
MSHLYLCVLPYIKGSYIFEKGKNYRFEGNPNFEGTRSELRQQNYTATREQPPGTTSSSSNEIPTLDGTEMQLFFSLVKTGGKRKSRKQRKTTKQKTPRTPRKSRKSIKNT